MSGSSLLGFIVSLIVLFAVAAIFFISIDRVAKDAFLARIAKIAVGCLVLIVFVLAIAAVLGLGGAAAPISPSGILVFAVGVLVLVVVLYLIDLFLSWLAPQLGMAAGIVSAIQYVVSAVALIALLYVAGNALLGGTLHGINWHG